MAVKNYAASDLVQRMTDLYAGLVRYHSSHWQVLGGGVLHRGFGTLTQDQWVNVPDDTIFITNVYNEVMGDLLKMEHSRPALSASLLAVSVSAFNSAAQTSFAG